MDGNLEGKTVDIALMKMESRSRQDRSKFSTKHPPEGFSNFVLSNDPHLFEGMVEELDGQIVAH